MGSNKRPDPSRRKAKHDTTDMSMMRIAVAGTGGLARLIAHYIEQDTSHHVVFLSRSVCQPLHFHHTTFALQHSTRHENLTYTRAGYKALTLSQQQPQLSAAGYQVAVIDYSEPDTLRFALRGIDTVISTVTGPNQIQLIQAAVAARVRRFAPAEFEGPPQLRAANDPLDRGRTIARQWLSHYAQNIQSTAFICGIFYERFQPGGMAQSQIGINSGLSAEGDYIMNCRTNAAQAPAYDHNNEPTATICMTAAQDVARFVTQALDLRTWPHELRMHGQRIEVKDLILQVQRLTGEWWCWEWLFSGKLLTLSQGVLSTFNGMARSHCGLKCRLQ